MRGFGRVGLAAGFLFSLAWAGPAIADPCDDVDGTSVSVSTVIGEVEKDTDGLTIWIRDNVSVGGCDLDTIETRNRPPKQCAPGARIDASGTFADYFFYTAVVADSFSCH